MLGFAAALPAFAFHGERLNEMGASGLEEVTRFLREHVAQLAALMAAQSASPAPPLSSAAPARPVPVPGAAASLESAPSDDDGAQLAVRSPAIASPLCL